MSEYTKVKRIPAYYVRGGTSKGVFFKEADLPPEAQQPGNIRDTLLQRVMGSPDPYAQQIDGMGGATSSTSKVVILAPSAQANHDVDYLFGQVAVQNALIDWSGNCGNLTAAVGSMAIEMGIIEASRLPDEGSFPVRVWQKNIQKSIIVHVPIQQGKVVETGDFELDGVTFAASEIKVEFLDPAGEGCLFPTGQLTDNLEVPGIGNLKVTMISAGIPTVFVRASEIGYQGTELQKDINSDTAALAHLEAIRQAASIKMGLTTTLEEAAARQHTPKVAFVAAPVDYMASDGKTITSESIDLCVRAVSMGKLHHAMMGTAAVAIATAAKIPGTVVADCSRSSTTEWVRFGHPSGTLKVGAVMQQKDQEWIAERVMMSRSARVLMEGFVRVPS